jgi:hypothetical protein
MVTSCVRPTPRTVDNKDQMYACLRHLPQGHCGLQDLPLGQLRHWNLVLESHVRHGYKLFICVCGVLRRENLEAAGLYKEPYQMYLNTILTCVKLVAVDHVGQLFHTRENMQL